MSAVASSCRTPIPFPPGGTKIQGIGAAATDLGQDGFAKVLGAGQPRVEVARLGRRRGEICCVKKKGTTFVINR